MLEERESFDGRRDANAPIRSENETCDCAHISHIVISLDERQFQEYGGTIPDGLPNGEGCERLCQGTWSQGLKLNFVYGLNRHRISPFLTLRSSRAQHGVASWLSTTHSSRTATPRTSRSRRRCSRSSRSSASPWYRRRALRVFRDDAILTLPLIVAP